MIRRGVKGAAHTQSGDSYFASLNDLLVGMLFIFIILLMAFALSYQSAERDLDSQISKLKDELGGRASARSDLLGKLGKALTDRGVTVVVEPDKGVLRLPEKTLFPSGSADLGPAGQQALQVLATTLDRLLPCYVEGASKARGCPKGTEAVLEAVYIEGHTDNIPISTGRYSDNWDLSSARAIKTYRYMLQVAPSLGTIRNAAGSASLFGASAYGDQRPLSPNSNLTDRGRAENRRIELRFLLAPPTKDDLDVSHVAILGRAK